MPHRMFGPLSVCTGRVLASYIRSTLALPSASLARPHLEYGAQVWHPYLAKDTNALEKFKSLDDRFVQEKGS